MSKAIPLVKQLSKRDLGIVLHSQQIGLIRREPGLAQGAPECLSSTSACPQQSDEATGDSPNEDGD